MLMKHAIFLIGWLGICMNLRLVILILTSAPCIPDYAPSMCTIWCCSDHDSTSCPYYISDEGFARLSNMIKAMNMQQAEFESKMREYDLWHETDLRFSSSKLDVCLCDDGASFTPLEFGLEAVLYSSQTTLSVVAPPLSSTLKDYTTFNMTLLNPPLLLAHLTEFEVGESLLLLLVLMRMTSVMSQTMFLLRPMILMRLLQGSLMLMSWLLC